ncbi:MAG: polysaccharide biosynthesis/export family protein [Candidatus Omnitrophica bacterium]|nr:polysaccharide biosynthesis/export family protein [Candidatus Omnitrophota bacterium]
MALEKRLTITDVAKTLGITPRTIMRWEKAGKIKKSRRDWRGWRFYHEEDVEEIKRFLESSYDVNDEGRPLAEVGKALVVLALAISAGLFTYIIGSTAHAGSNFEPAKVPSDQVIQETPTTVDINLDALKAVQAPPAAMTEDVKYTLGPNDVIEITVRRHPEFSGQYEITSEGKIEYKFVGDVVAEGLTKAELKDRITEILEDYLIEPEVDVTILAYLSKVFYVVGEVGNPGKFYMRGNTINAREAFMQAGLPTQAAALKGCRLITPDQKGGRNYKTINALSLLYEGNLSENLEMNPGDVLYVPSTVMAKIIRVISPVTNITGQTAGAVATGAALIP